MNQYPATIAPTPIRDLSILENEITELAAHINAATYRLLTLIREYDERQGWGGGGLKSCAHWLNWKCGINLGAAREKVRVAHALQHLPHISAALRNGRISFSKVRAMTRVATEQNEDYLLMIADHGTAAHVERLVRQYRRVKRSEALERDSKLHALREFNWYIDDDGSYVLKGRLSPEQGARVVQALDTAMGTLYEEQRSSAENVSAETPVAAKRADALERIADTFLINSNSNSNSDNDTPATIKGGDRCTLHLHTDISTLKADGEDAESELASGGHVCAETSRRLACDCGVVHWLENSEGTALDIGRRTRSIPPAIRRALERRDGGCRFPGCTARHHVDAQSLPRFIGYHVKHWADGGETRLDNLLLLCRHHHRLVHEGGYGLALESNEPVFTTPNGKLIPQGPDSRFSGNVFALTTANRREQINIDAATLVPLWHGDKMDDGMAVDGLLRRE